ncbi:MAG TPA: hypothetical protein VGI60_00400 [Chthoniobacterales bacterium]|jgi:hypothetical protein
MFPLQTKSLPENADRLRDALEESLRQFVRPAAHRLVTLEDKNYPELEAIRVSLDGATAGERLPARPVPVDPVEPALRATHFEISGQPVLVQGAAVHLECRAREVRIGQAHDAAGNLLLLLQDASDGTVEVAISQPDLEALVRAGASAATKGQGIILEDVRVQLQALSERALAATVCVRARKLFLNAAVEVKGRVEIDEEMTAHLSGLVCSGEGTLGTIACGFLGPHLQRFEGRTFSLLALPLGEVRLRDIRLSIDDRLRVHAEFGHTA